MDTDDLFKAFFGSRSKEELAQDRRIRDSVMPSDFFPKAGEHFRVRSATVACRGHMGDIFLCLEAQDGAAIGRKVLDTYTGRTGRGIGEISQFVAGDVIFYDCTKMWAAVEADKAAEGKPEVQK